MKKQINLISCSTGLPSTQAIASSNSRNGNLISNFNFLLLSLIFFTATIVSAQTPAEKDIAFKKVLTERSGKIVSSLNIANSRKQEKVIAIIASQYYDLNKVHDNIKEEKEKEKQLAQLHKKFIAKLNKKLTDTQVEQVKNGMTYNVLNVTYAAYNDMILSLSDEQKEKIYNWLIEAREIAMDQGSSDEKHKVFGKYKGRINNYLSAQGYDMKAEEKAWQQRLRKKREEEAATKKVQSA
jgi:Spy/CpxP family protein refolding chaperone